MWIEINNQDDIDFFMGQVENFHDSCIKEMQYVSGAYVTETLSMYPINNKRILNVIIQRQYEELSMIEMQFIGLEFLQLFPINEKYTCEIFDSTLFFRDEYLCWCDNSDIPQNNFEDYEGTFICASKLRWRVIEKKLGNDAFYVPIAE